MEGLTSGSPGWTLGDVLASLLRHSPAAVEVVHVQRRHGAPGGGRGGIDGKRGAGRRRASPYISLMLVWVRAQTPS
jgi:hypothetical protein